jgi:hypothetical protein
VGVVALGIFAFGWSLRGAAGEKKGVVPASPVIVTEVAEGTPTGLWVVESQLTAPVSSTVAEAPTGPSTHAVASKVGVRLDMTCHWRNGMS